MLETWASLMDKSKGRDKVLVCTACPGGAQSADLPENRPVHVPHVSLRPGTDRGCATAFPMVHLQREAHEAIRRWSQSDAQMPAPVEPAATDWSFDLAGAHQRPGVLRTYRRPC